MFLRCLKKSLLCCAFCFSFCFSTRRGPVPVSLRAIVTTRSRSLLDFAFVISLNLPTFSVSLCLRRRCCSWQLVHFFVFIFVYLSLIEQNRLSSTSSAPSLCAHARVCLHPTAPVVDGAEGDSNRDIGRELQDRLESGPGRNVAGRSIMQGGRTPPFRRRASRGTALSGGGTRILVWFKTK